MEDAKLLAGHVALVRGDDATAGDLFLKSSQPIEALKVLCVFCSQDPHTGPDAP